MKRLTWPVIVLFSSQLGRCPTCMRIAFRAALLSWVIAAITFVLSQNSLFVVVSLLLSAGFTALWLAHIAAFSTRSLKASARRKSVAAKSANASPQSLVLRRKFLASFAQIFLFAAMATIIPVSVASAQDCNCYTDNDCSCPPDSPNCFFNAATGVGYCCALSVGCGNNDDQWCCPRQCGGDTGTCLG